MSVPLLQSWPARALRGLSKQVLHELRLHGLRMRQPKLRPCVVVFPSNQPWDAASNLRAWWIAPELERLGWRVIVVPEPLSLRQRRRILALEQPDVVFLQQIRHTLNQPSLYRPYPCVLDADDADYLDKVAQAAVGLQPIASSNEFSKGKSFGKLLAYLAGQVAVVASDAVDHPLFFESWRNGVLLPENESAWADAIVKLIETPELRCRLARAGYQDFEARLTSEVFARKLDPILRAAARLS